MSTENRAETTDWRTLGNRGEAALAAEQNAALATHNQAFTDAVLVQGEQFFRFHEVKALLAQIEYLHLRTAIISHPISEWRPHALAALALIKGGMTAEDVIDHGLRITRQVMQDQFTARPEDAGACVAAIAAACKLSGDHLEVIPSIVARSREGM